MLQAGAVPDQSHDAGALRFERQPGDRTDRGQMTVSAV
jgi:hypothetical protein